VSQRASCASSCDEVLQQNFLHKQDEILLYKRGEGVFLRSNPDGIRITTITLPTRMADGVLKKDGQVGEVMVIPPPPHPPVPGDVVSPDVPIGVRTGLPQMHKQTPIELSLGAVGQMVVGSSERLQAIAMGLAEGGKGKNKYAPKKCEHGR
jgi:hypothetical protein